jgi:Undecaprenyl-phosphate glucose phosphotransferase
MSSVPDSWRISLRPQRWQAAARHVFTVGFVVADAMVIVAVSVLMGAIYHEFVYSGLGPLASFLQVGFMAACIFVLPAIFYGEYSLAHYLSFKPHVRRVFTLWNVTFLCLLALGFLTRAMEDYSRGSIVLFYLVGLPAIMLMRYTLVGTAIHGSRTGLVTSRRVFLIGRPNAISSFLRRYEPWKFGLQTVGAASLTAEAGEGEAQALDDDLQQALDSARLLRPDAVYIIAPWSDTRTIDRCIEAFLKIPVEIHVGPEQILDRFDDVRISKLGPIASLQFTRAPLTWFEQLQKRVFDVVLAAWALILLTPLFLVVTFLIWLESGRPTLFLQRRYGFNQRPFRIIKFRTMNALDDGDIVPQATANDGRVTRIGRWLRRWNVDEMPQLINVLKGDMSLVGPRPHALSHNHEFEQKISQYARRHNVLPGITGWAQVNGFRGETETDDKMRRRIEHDLYYIDNWSLWLDLRILFLTVFSRRKRGERRIERHHALLVRAEPAHRHGAFRCFLAPDHEQDRHLGERVLAHLVVDLLVAQVELGAQAAFERQ